MRKLALTAHVTASVGWLGAVVAFLALAVAAMVVQDERSVRGAYLAMEVTGWWVLVPFSVLSLLTGLVQALGTSWGLLRHYWVLTKLVITALATAVLLAYSPTLGYFAGAAQDTAMPVGGTGVLPNPSPVLHAGAAVLVLAGAVVLSVYKPRGMTRYGQRKHHSGVCSPSRKPFGLP